tara:strand:+ start:5672 stop:7579 length:1908 start_codon:yes stop_codon:yes gene_type:complete
MCTKKISIFLLIISPFLFFGQVNDFEKYYLELQKSFHEKDIIENERIDYYIERNAQSKRPAKITFDGVPIFFETHNLESMVDTKTNLIVPGGSEGLNLEGSGFNVGVWDGGHVFKFHDEFQNVSDRIVIGNDLSFQLNYSSHATHVAGTIGSSGINSEARGMASKVKIISFDWSRVMIELLMDSSKDIHISNHSYGIDGFSISGTPNISYSYFGTYDDWAEDLDAIHFAKPHHLAICSAGNDGTYINTDSVISRYDKLTDMSTAKNNLVVANAKKILYFESGFELIRINESSSQGPTNDLRIKPDISGIGTNILSTDLNTNNITVTNLYSRKTGTSMAAPNISGSMVLLQEYFYNTQGRLPLSSTLKALVINSAKEAGDSGPDPNFGWGIMDASKSSQIITRHISKPTIIEGKIFDGQKIMYDLELSEDIDQYSITICWTDPGATNLYPQINKDVSVLINDIDLRVVENLSIEHLPYAFSVENKINNDIWAIKSDNKVDNVERIDFARNEGSNYKVVISHKGKITNPALSDDETEYQNFSIVVSEGANINKTLNNKSVDMFQNEFFIIYELDFINLINPNQLFINEIYVYDYNGKLIFNQNYQGTQLNYKIHNSPKRGVIVIKSGNENFVKKYIK